MDLRIRGRNLEITPLVREHVAAKLATMDRHLPNISRAEVELVSEPTAASKDRVFVQVTLAAGKYRLRTQQRGPNAAAAMNAAVHALDRQIKRYKSQVYRSEREQRGALDPFQELLAAAPEEEAAEAEPATL